MLRTDKSAFEEGVFKKLFIRLIVGIFLVSLAIGVVRGYILFTETAFRIPAVRWKHVLFTKALDVTPLILYMTVMVCNGLFVVYANSSRLV